MLASHHIQKKQKEIQRIGTTPGQSVKKKVSKKNYRGRVCVRGVGGGGVRLVLKALSQLANFTLGPDATLNTEIHKFGSHKGSKLSQCIKAKT